MSTTCTTRYVAIHLSSKINKNYLVRHTSIIALLFSAHQRNVMPNNAIVRHCTANATPFNKSRFESKSATNATNANSKLIDSPNAIGEADFLSRQHRLKTPACNNAQQKRAI